MKEIHIYLKQGPRPFPMGDNYEIAKIHLRIKKSSSLELLGQFQPDWAQSILG